MSTVDSNNLMQVCIVVKDVEKVAKAYAKLFNMAVPEIRHIRSIDRTPVYYKGQLTEFEAKLCVFEMGNVVLEITEPVLGNNAWQDYIDQYGEGVHHIGFTVSDLNGAMNAFKEIGIEPLHVGYFEKGSYSFMDSINQFGVRINIKHSGENNKELIDQIYNFK